VYHRTGRLDEADGCLRKGIAVWRASGAAQFLNWALTFQAELHLDLNGVDQAVATLEESLALSQEAHDPWVEGIAWRLLGRACRLKGDWPAAERYLVKSIETHERLGSQVEHGRSLYEYGLLQQAMGDVEKARALFGQAKGIFEARGAKYDLARAEEALSVVRG
jgi:tetratricopeptide (TPR) repeat protein